MEGKLFFGIFVLFISNCFSQDPVKRPEFPNVFQTEVQGIFINEKEVAELDGVLYYDRNKNRGALLYTYKNETTTSIYNFDINEIISIDDNNNCIVEDIPDKPEESFFEFTLDKGKKKIVGAEEFFFFTKAELDLQELSIIPSLIYKSKLNITQYGKSNCDVIHIFSKPDVELPTCTDQNLCEPTLMTISVRCKNNDGGIEVDHSYNFFRFRRGTVDESAFFPPAGAYCDMKNTRELPQFPSYFSFTFDIIEKPISSNYLAFSMNKKVWYDSNYQIIRIDEFDHTGQLYSSRIFDVKAAIAFTIIATIPTCDVGPIDSNVHFDEITRLPKVFFAPNDTTSSGAVYVGKRDVHGLEHHVWSLMWTDSDSDAKIVEEIHYLEIVPNEQLKLVKDVKPYLQISHIDIYTYEMNDDKGVYELTLLKHLEINNFRTEPKEWAEFDVAACFNSSQKLIFLMKLEGPPIVKGSLSYLEVLESLYNNIIAATRVSVLRISELTGVFDGVQLVEVRGSILDNSNSTGWQSKSSEPGAKETFRLIKQAAFQGKLTVTFKNENDQIRQLNVTSVEAIMIPEDPLPKPEFPEVFQTEVQGIFTIDNEVSELDGVLYYDRNMDRAALLYTYKNETTSIIYNFDINQMTSIDDNDNCVVEKIPDNPEEAFFKFTFWPFGRKELIEPKEFFLFTKAELDRQQLSTVPALVYTSKVNITKYGQSNCDVIHVFSKPDVELPTCTEENICKPTLKTISVNCKNTDGDTVVDHVYNFFRFRRGTVDETAFLPPAGVYCDMKYTRELPEFPSYFSFTFDIVEKPISSNYLVFSTYKKVWYDSNYKIIRIDEFDYTGLLYSSRIFDVKAATAFTIIATVPTCDAGPIDSNVPFDEITRLPKAFFAPNDTTSSGAVYAGKRTVHGLEYEVWSLMWTVSDSGVKIVEEIHYLEIVPNEELQLVEDIKPYLQISHVDTYTYEMNDDKGVHELTLLKHLSINNFRTKPKEWAAFDVAACFNNSQKMDFVIKLEGPPLVKGSQSYREVLELLYNNIIAATGVSVLRISELTGVFDGVQLEEVRGSILDNSESTGWQSKSSEPGAEETFRLIKQAASQEKLTVTFKNENNQTSQFNVTSVEAVKAPAEPGPGFSGASIAAAGVVMLILGIIFGIAGYYVFLKKRKKPGNFFPLKELNE